MAAVGIALAKCLVFVLENCQALPVHSQKKRKKTEGGGGELKHTYNVGYASVIFIW